MRCFCIVVYLSAFLWADAARRENDSALHPSEEGPVNFNQNSPEVERASKDSSVLNEKNSYESLTDISHFDGHGTPVTQTYPRKGKTSTPKPKPTPKASGTGSPLTPKGNGTAAEVAMESERIKKQAHSLGDVRPTTSIRTKNNKDLRGTDALKQRRQISQVKNEGWTPLSLKSNGTVPEVTMAPERIKKQSRLSMVVDPTNSIQSQDVGGREFRQLSESNSGAGTPQPQKSNGSLSEVIMEPERIKKQAHSSSELRPTSWILTKNNKEIQDADDLKQSSQLSQDVFDTNGNEYQFQSLSSKLVPQRISGNVEYFDDGCDSESKDLIDTNGQNMNQNKWDCEDFLRGSDIEWEDEDENGEYGRPARSPQFPIEWEEQESPDTKMAYDATYIYY